MASLGGARFAWQSDYGQFYLIDMQDTGFLAPEDITQEMVSRRCFVPAVGLVVYTAGCLQQHIDIRIHDARPDTLDCELESGRGWTQVEVAQVRFPSRSFTISSPSAPDPFPCGPVFFVPHEQMAAHIGWVEFQGVRDESVPVEPDIIQVTLWPA
ncbi:hypothetical protein [Bordetella genomosp. 13]|uniref:hypothetical protein n=1 Tax=Bordetella genomosp. 13 TaxID=463040 RepID=UPI0011A277AD|nr:hypothetical protein [Bordetella genomosp. 13]